MAIHGLGGAPSVDLSAHIPTQDLESIHREICVALVRLPTTYTGGFHASTGRLLDAGYPESYDYGRLILDMEDWQREAYLALAPEQPHAEVNEALLSRVPNHRQKQFLKVALGAYFPWQTYLRVFPGIRDRGTLDLRGPHRMSRQVEGALPRLLAWVESLPLESVDKLDILGLDPHQGAVIHRDWPTPPSKPSEFIHVTPQRNKRLFVYDPDSGTKHYCPALACTFNNFDYHGVEPGPTFSYSIRVEGTFDDSLREWIAGGRA